MHSTAHPYWVLFVPLVSLHVSLSLFLVKASAGQTSIGDILRWWRHQRPFSLNEDRFLKPGWSGSMTDWPVERVLCGEELADNTERALQKGPLYEREKRRYRNDTFWTYRK